MNKREEAQANRTYHVLSVALLEEKRVTNMPREVFDQRHRELVATCYGDNEEARRLEKTLRSFIKEEP